MKFIKLESRGGNYLVVASNVAWLRSAENGQTNVGIVGGQPLLVIGSIEEVAEKILAGLAGGYDSPAPVPAAPAAPQPAVVPIPAPVAAAPEPQNEPEPEPSAPRPAPPVRARVASARSASMWERPAAAQNPKIKAGSQRMMGRLE